MKPIASSLLEAQRSVSAEPYVDAVVRDEDTVGRRARWSRYYTGSEALGVVAALFAADGSLVRPRVEFGTLYVSRVAAPDDASDYSSWSSLFSVSFGSGVALTLYDGQPALFYVHTNDDTLRWVRSSDHGATWGSAADITSAGPSGKGPLAAAAAGPSGTDILLVWGELGDGNVYSSRYNGSSWSTRAAWSLDLQAVQGLALAYNGDWQVAVAGQEDGTGDPGLWTCVYGHGFLQAVDTWSSALHMVAESASGAGWWFLSPALAEIQAKWWLFFSELYQDEIAYTRLQYATMDSAAQLSQVGFRESSAFDYAETVSFGSALAVAADGALWLVTTRGVWRGEFLPPILGVDVSALVVEASVEVSDQGGAARLVLDNEGGRAAAALSVYPSIRGLRLNLSPGYRTSAEAGYNVAAFRDVYFVERVTVQTGAEPRLILESIDPWGVIGRLRSRRQYVYNLDGMPHRTVVQVLAQLVRRAGFRLGVSGDDLSTEYVDLVTPFTVQVGEQGIGIRRWLAKVRDVARWRQGVMLVKDPRPTEAASYAFGPGEHTIRAARYTDQGPAFNWARVLATDVYAEAFDFEDIENVGQRARTVVDLGLVWDNETAARAVAELRSARIGRRHAEVEVFGVHCGVELWDVVEVEDAEAGESRDWRVVGYSWRYGPGEYFMTLRLGAV